MTTEPAKVSRGGDVRDGPKAEQSPEDRDKTLAATKPWEAAGMSRRTWYRRQAEQRTK
jgi:hypothetical protein